MISIQKADSRKRTDPRGKPVELHTKTMGFRQRIVPTPNHLEALLGIWELDGEMIRMMEEPGTGALAALNSRGEWVNPMPVISRGAKR